MAWATSTRRDRLPKDWPNIRAKIIRRARGMCEDHGRDSGTQQGSRRNAATS